MSQNWHSTCHIWISKYENSFVAIANLLPAYYLLVFTKFKSYQKPMIKYNLALPIFWLFCVYLRISFRKLFSFLRQTFQIFKCHDVIKCLCFFLSFLDVYLHGENQNDACMFLFDVLLIKESCSLIGLEKCRL